MPRLPLTAIILPLSLTTWQAAHYPASLNTATRTTTPTTRAKACKRKRRIYHMAQKTGALILDETADRYDIRFDIADYYGGLHCGECMDVFTGGKWKPTRIEYGDELVSCRYPRRGLERAAGADLTGRREERTPFFTPKRRRTTLTLSLLPGKEDGKHCKMKSTKKWLRSLSRERS